MARDWRSGVLSGVRDVMVSPAGSGLFQPQCVQQPTPCCGAGLGLLDCREVVFVTGAFRRSIPVADFEYLAGTDQAGGLSDLLGFTNMGQVSKLLQAELVLVLTSRLLNTRLGEAILARVAKIIYPLKAPGAGIPALRAGVINALVAGDDTINAIGFMQAYPVDELEVSIPALMNVLAKAQSISQLISFFSDSPLDGLRGDNEAAP